ncbi:MAG TPA: tetratricopeptide repeat protein [Bryobacteraceae bacterium]|nr:tetratricopeptide repeat protein [Bryobacteraceae bacterium]
MALLTPLRADKTELNWTALQRQVAELLKHGSIAEAEKVLEAGIEAARQPNETSEGLAKVLNDLGTLYHDSGRLVDADRAYSESLSIWRRGAGKNPKVGTTLQNLAGLRLAQGRASDAEKLYIEARELFVSAYGVDSPEVTNALVGLAEVYCEMGRYENARQLGEHVLSILVATRDNPQLGAAFFVLAKTAWKQNRDEEAERLLRRAIETLRVLLGPQHLTVVSGLVSLAVLTSGKNPQEADQLFCEALQSVETQLGPNHALTGSILVLYARHLEQHGRKGEGKRLKRRGEEILARHSRENGLGHTLDIQAFQRRNAR